MLNIVDTHGSIVSHSAIFYPSSRLPNDCWIRLDPTDYPDSSRKVPAVIVWMAYYVF